MLKCVSLGGVLICNILKFVILKCFEVFPTFVLLKKWFVFPKLLNDAELLAKLLNDAELLAKLPNDDTELLAKLLNDAELLAKLLNDAELLAKLLNDAELRWVFLMCSTAVAFSNIQKKLSSSNTDGSFTTAISNSFLSP